MNLYLVGGAVRDKLLGSPFTEKDWVVVGATPEEIIELDTSRVKVRHSAGEFVVVWMGEGNLSTEDSWYCPEFGLREKNVALAFAATAPGECSFCIAPDDSCASFAL